MSKDTRKQRRALTRRDFLRSSAALSAVAMSACSGFDRSGDSKILRLSSYSDIRILDPAYTLSQAEVIVMPALQSNLILHRSGSSWEWELDAAQSVEKLDDRNIKFVLRPGIEFTHGFGELTADDVKYSFERIIDPELSSPNRGEWGPLNRVDVIDRYTGIIVLDEPFEPLWMVTLSTNAGTIVSRKAVEAVGGRFGSSPPCFSGPFTLREYIPKQRTVLVRNDAWSGLRPDFDEIRIFPIEDEKTAEIAFDAGDVDFTRTSLSSLPVLVDRDFPEETITVYPELRYCWLGLNMEHPLLQDARVRRAIQLGVDVEKVVEAAWFRAAQPATGIVAPGLLGHRPFSLLPVNGDPAQARELLRNAGYSTGLALTLDVQNTTRYITAGQILQSQLAEIGVDVEVNLHERGSFSTLGSEAAGGRWRDIQLILNEFAMTPDPFYGTLWFTEEQVGVWNWERFRDVEFNRLHLEARRESDPTKRSLMYHRMQDIMEESGGYRFITHGARSLIYRNALVPSLKPDGTSVLREFRRKKDT